MRNWTRTTRIKRERQYLKTNIVASGSSFDGGLVLELVLLHHVGVVPNNYDDDDYDDSDSEPGSRHNTCGEGQQAREQ